MPSGDHDGVEYGGVKCAEENSWRTPEPSEFIIMMSTGPGPPMPGELGMFVVNRMPFPWGDHRGDPRRLDDGLTDVSWVATPPVDGTV